MYDYKSPSDLIDVDLLCVDLDAATQSSVAEKLVTDSISSLSLSSEQALEGLSQHEAKVIFFKMAKDNFSKQLQNIINIQNKQNSMTLLVYSENLQAEQVSQLINGTSVFSIIDKVESFANVLKKALEDHKDRKHYYSSLSQVKEQNKKLESLNQNLEELVHERTKKEFIANTQMESSVKGIQSILSFIKTVSRSEGIEDLMSHIRNEFKKIHGLMPPILLLKSGAKELRAFYFQGKQLTEKVTDSSFLDEALGTSEEGAMRSGLSNLLGRPFGTVLTTDLVFKSQELQSMQCKMIFEHSLSDKKYSDYAEYAFERWPIINMALENILLKEGLQNIARQWSRTFNEMKDPIIIIDKKYNMTLSNAGYHKDKEKTCYQAFAGLDKPCKDCPMTKTFDTGKPQTSDIHISGKVFRVHSYPIRLEGYDTVSHVINQYVDVTQTIDLQSRVIQGEKMAAVGLLAGNIAHELNNPLTGIFSLSELLLEDFSKESNTYKDLNEIKGAAERCQRIIKDLLDFSSVGSDSHAKTIDVNILIAKTVPLLKMAMRSLNSDIDLCEEDLLVDCNPQLLQQVFFNLINNACQAMEESGQLTVVTRVHQGFAEIAIRDTGSGIPEEVKDSIFDPFFTTKEEGKGTGLGLSMSKSVVERAGGTLILNEDYKDGTEFLIKLPMVDK